MSKVDSYIVIDTETGGLNCLMSPILELGFVVLNPETLMEKHHINQIGEYKRCGITDITLHPNALSHWVHIDIYGNMTKPVCAKCRRSGKT